MLCDVVKTKSKVVQTIRYIVHILFAVILLIKAPIAIKKIYIYARTSAQCPITLNEIRHVNPRICVDFTYTVDGQEYHKSQYIDYLKVRSNDHYQRILPDLEKKLTTCFLMKDRAEIASINRFFPFQESIYIALCVLSYFLVLQITNNFIFKRLD